MSTATQTLTDFLLARIEEDREVAQAAVNLDRRFPGDEGWTPAGLSDPWPEEKAHIARHDPARVLAECKAKREVVETYQGLREEAKRLHHAGADEGLIQTARNMYAGLEMALRSLALPYAEHEDYDEGWRP